MEYMLIIHDSEATSPRPGGPGWDEYMAAYYAFTEEVKARGKYQGAPLSPINTATTVRIRDGKTITTDGPFAETKEWMSGYYVVECKDLDEALALASRIPSAKYGSVEVRPIMNMTAGKH